MLDRTLTTPSILIVHFRFKLVWCTSSMYGLNQESAYQENAVSSTWLCTTVIKGST